MKKWNIIAGIKGDEWEIASEAQLLYSYQAPCNDNNEECDVDIVYIYAMPDGSTKEVRSHTY